MEDLKSIIPAGKQGIIEHDKGTNNSLKSKILSALKSEKCTAIQLNRRFCFNDSRKTISLLRRDGYNIGDYKLRDGRKVYFFQSDGQLELFEKGGVALC